MIAYIQKQNNEWLNENCYAAQYGFYRMGYEIKSFEKNQIDSIIITNENVVFGGINTLHEIMKLNDITIPSVPDITECLDLNLGRKIFKSTIKAVKEEEIPYPFFIKPMEYKLFNGTVCKSKWDIISNKKIMTLPDDCPVLISEVVNFISEHRCFVLNRELVGCKNYTGDFTVNPQFHDFQFIRRIISTYKNSPSAYTLDVGIFDKGGNDSIAVIEINDGYGFGAYGLNPIVFCRMIQKRWQEIITQKKGE